MFNQLLKSGVRASVLWFYTMASIMSSELFISCSEESSSRLWEDIESESVQKELLVGEWQGTTSLFELTGNFYEKLSSSLTIKENGEYIEIITVPGFKDQGGGVLDGTVSLECTYYIYGDYIYLETTVPTKRRFKVTEKKLYLSDRISQTEDPETPPDFTAEFDRVE